MMKLTQDCVEWIKSLGIKQAVIGISGGKDSSVCAALCVAALGKENVLGVMMPNGVQKDIADSQKLCAHLGIKNMTVNIGGAFDALLNAIAPRDEISYDTVTNLPARLRMSTLYAVAQTYGGWVANTCNLSEDTVGYATLYGDSAGSFAPLSKLTTEEIMEIGDDLGLPTELVHKTPIDGLQPKTDEDKLGFTYHEVNELIRFAKMGPNFEKIMQMYKANKFKTDIIQIPAFDPQRLNHIPVIADGVLVPKDGFFVVAGKTENG